MSQMGSFVSISTGLMDVRPTPISGAIAHIAAPPLSAMNGLKHCNKRGRIGWLFNHLVGAGEQSRRHREAERPSSFEVDQ
jgi:hypothetical protein